MSRARGLVSPPARPGAISRSRVASRAKARLGAISLVCRIYTSTFTLRQLRGFTEILNHQPLLPV